MNASESSEAYRRLREIVLDETATAQEIAEFESIVLGSPELRRDFASRLMERSAMILWDHSKVPAKTLETSSTTAWSSKVTSMIMFAGLTTTIAILCLGFFLNRDVTCATILKTDNCVWGETSFPTLANHRIASGYLRLREGLVKLHFDHGATVTMEGPAVLEVIDRQSCRLYSGRAYSEISPGGEGFLMETPTGRFTDRGTVFGLNVEENGSTLLSVFDGQVDVDHRTSQKMLSVFTDSTARVSETELSLVKSISDSPPRTLSPSATADGGSVIPEERTARISTSTGLGSDAFVQPKHNLRVEFPTPENALLLKRTTDTVWNRRIYLRFDVSLVEKATVESVELQIHGVDTKMGYLSRVSDSVVSVFALTDESEDFWSEDTLTWNNSPAAVVGQFDVDPARSEPVGEFTVSPSRSTGLFTMNDPRLLDFIHRDTNGVVTLILNCGQVVDVKQGYVYGFASKSHPNTPAPSLWLSLSNSSKP